MRSKRRAEMRKVVRSDHATEETPNIIFLQMESFFDVNHLKGVTYSENPVPEFHLDERELYIWFPDDAVFRRRHCEYGI